MSYAVRNDGQGWRAVANLTDVGLDEWFCLDSPPDLVPLQPTVVEMAAAAVGRRDQLLGIAANRMGPLQDAIDEKTATEEEAASLKSWRQYRIALNRIDQQVGFPVNIEWPVPPDTANAL